MGSGWGLNRWWDRALYCHKSSTGGREQVLLICDDAHHFAKKCLLLGFLRARNLLLLIFRLLPTGIGVEFLHGFGERIRLLAEILLIHHAIPADHECHHAR